MNYIYSLSFNLNTETDKATERLYAQNENNFTHFIVDLGFPLIKGDEIPDNIQEAQEQNSEGLKELAKKFGSEYVKFPNIGCSQNTSAIYKHISPSDEDVLISCEPDEVQVEDGWVNALANSINGGLAFCAPRLIEHKEFLEKSPLAKLQTVGGEQVYVMSGLINYGQVGYSCKFLNRFGGIAAPSQAPIYGYLESVLMKMVDKCSLPWGILKDYTTDHTDFEKGNEGTSKLLREWKNYSVFSGKPQIQFSDWLIKKRNNDL